MSLMYCPECSESVSSHAETCPHCGFPLIWYTPKPKPRQLQTEDIIAKVIQDWFTAKTLQEPNLSLEELLTDEYIEDLEKQLIKASGSIKSNGFLAGYLVDVIIISGSELPILYLCGSLRTWFYKQPFDRKFLWTIRRLGNMRPWWGGLPQYIASQPRYERDS